MLNRKYCSLLKYKMTEDKTVLVINDGYIAMQDNQDVVFLYIDQWVSLFIGIAPK